MVGETPNIDRIGNDGAIFMDLRGRCRAVPTVGRNALLHRHASGAHLRWSRRNCSGRTSCLRSGSAGKQVWFLRRPRATRPARPGKNHLGDSHRYSLPTAHGFPRVLGDTFYHLDAMQGVSFPDLNKNPTTLTRVAPPCKNTPIPGLPEVPGAVDPKTTTCLTPPRPVRCKSSDGTSKNQTCQDQGPLTLERSKTVDEEISSHVIDFLDRNDPKKTNKPFFVWYNPARMHVTTVLPDKYMAMVGEPSREGLGANELPA